jgi:hypothetical protein
VTESNNFAPAYDHISLMKAVDGGSPANGAAAVSEILSKPTFKEQETPLDRL